MRAQKLLSFVIVAGIIPVCVGGADSVLGALGLGITGAGQVAYIAGTSNVILGLSGTAAADPDLGIWVYRARLVRGEPDLAADWFVAYGTKLSTSIGAGLGRTGRT